MIGQTISHYKILEKLGEGGMGVVYKADDTKLRRSVALKFLAPELTRDAEAKKQFIHEAQAVSALDHPNIAVVHEIDETDDGRSFICMAYYPGKTLKELIEEGPLPVDKALEIAVQIADGLQRAHEAGIIHRDIKPANIILTERSEVKIVDFGIAKLSGTTQQTGTGPTAGTAAYMSPEQAQGLVVDRRSDLFSLGIVLYEMLTGKRPFQGEHESAVLYAITSIDPQSPSVHRREVPPELDHIVLQLLQKNPDQRYQSAANVSEDLKNLSGVARRLALSLPKVRLTRRTVMLSALVLTTVTLLVTVSPWNLFFENWFGSSGIPEEKYITVLPFTNVGGDSMNQAFCDGLMETVTSKLTQLQAAHEPYWVVASSEVRQRRISSPIEARKAFGATIAISGSVQRMQHAVRLTLNLVDTETGMQMKSDLIDKPRESLSDLQEEVALKIADMLGLRLTEQTIQSLEGGKTVASQAYDFYLQGRGYLQNFQRISNIDLAIQLFQRALREDSTYALAHAALGEAYWRKFEMTKDRQWIEQARTNVDRAMKFDTGLAVVHFTTGLILKGTGEYGRAELEFKESMKLDSLNSDVYRELADTYVRKGNLVSAESTYRKAISIQPSYWAGYSYLGSFYFRQKRYQEAVGQFKRVVELTPDNARGYSGLGAALFYAGRQNEAEDALLCSVSIEPNYAAYNNLATLYFYDKKYKEMAQCYEKALALNDRDYVVWGNLASAYYWSGDREKAAERFRRAASMAEELRNIDPHDAVVLSRLADYYAMLGKNKEALQLVLQSLILAPEALDIITRAVSVYEQIGQREQTLKHVELAFKKGAAVQDFERSPALKELRSDVRYQSLVKQWGKKP